MSLEYGVACSLDQLAAERLVADYLKPAYCPG